MRCDARQFERVRRGGRATAVSVRPTGTAVEQYQVSLGNRPSLRPVGVVGTPSWSDPSTQAETWVRVPRLSATCPRRGIAFDGGKSAPGKTVFPLLFDDFDGSALDTETWTTDSASIVVTVTNSTISIPPATWLRALPEFSTNVAFIGVGRFGEAHLNQYSRFGFRYSSGGEYAALFTGNFGGSQWYTLVANPYPNYVGTEIGTTYTGIHTWEIIRNGSASSIYKIDGTVVSTHTTKNPTRTLHAILWTGDNASEQNSVWRFVAMRKYTPNEPIAGTAQPSATNRALCRPLSAADTLRAAVGG